MCLFVLKWHKNGESPHCYPQSLPRLNYNALTTQQPFVILMHVMEQCNGVCERWWNCFGADETTWWGELEQFLGVCERWWSWFAMMQQLNGCGKAVPQWLWSVLELLEVMQKLDGVWQNSAVVFVSGAGTVWRCCNQLGIQQLFRSFWKNFLCLFVCHTLNWQHLLTLMLPSYGSPNCYRLLLDMNKIKRFFNLCLFLFSYSSFFAQTNSLCCSPIFPASSKSDTFVIRFSSPVTPAICSTHLLNG